jgi:ABC-type transport system involved in multi-copper enzyme maturation permease subunit
MKKVNSIFILAVLGAKEWMRLKFFHLVIFIAILFIIFSHLLSSSTFAVQERLLFDFGLAGLEIGLVFISSLIGSHAIHREIERKTLFVLLARPIPRWHVVVGSWGALIFLNLIFTLGFSISFMSSAGFWNLFSGFVVASLSSVMKALVISSFALAMGLLVRPLLALGTAVCYWILCYSLPDIQYFVGKLQNPNLDAVVAIMDKVIPQFYRFNWKSYYYVTNQAASSEIMWAVCHCMAWTCLWLFLGSLFFQRKEIA